MYLGLAIGDTRCCNPTVTRDTGTLLAQVIPVMALALGIELRAFATKIDADRREDGKVDGRERGQADYAAAYVGVFIAVILAAGEQVAIAAANGVDNFAVRHLWTNPLVPESPPLGNVLTLSIVAVFLLPAFQVITATMPLDLTKTQRYLRSLKWVVALLLLAYFSPLAL